MAKVKIDVDSHEVEQALANLRRGATVLEPALEEIGRIIKTRIGLGFKFSKTPHGAPWLPLKLRKGQPLVDTGRLRSSITYEVSGSDSVTVGTNLNSEHHGHTYYYPRVHQFGAHIRPRWAKALRFKNPSTGESITSKGVYVPARPFMPLDRAGNIDLPPSWKASVLSALTKHLAGSAS